MAKLCAKGKAAAKRKFKVYPSAYANMYASGVCSGRIKPKASSKGKRNGKKRALRMGKRKMGRHWCTQKEWQVSTLWQVKGQ